MRERPSLTKWSSLAAFFLALLCVPPALAVEDGESLVASVCRIIDASALDQHLPVGFLTGLIWQESNFRPDAISPVGARGIAQFMPAVAAERGLANPNDPEAAIPKAAEFLASLKQRFGNLGLAAAAYNAGATRVADWLAGGGDLPPETRAYVMAVTRHPLEDWNGLGAAKLTDDAVFPDSSCVHRVAAVSRGEPAVFVNSAWAPWGLQISSSFSKGSAMWHEYAGALNNYLLSLPIQKFYSTYVSSQLRPDVLVCVALMIFLLFYIRRPLNNIRDEMRRNKLHMGAIIGSGAMDLTKPILSTPVPADDGPGLLHAKRAERQLERAEPRPSRRLLKTFDFKGHAATDKIFGALGRNGVATPQADETAIDRPAPPEFPAVAGSQNVAGDSALEEKPAARPPEVIPFADPAFRRPRPQAEKARARRLKPIAIGGGLALIATCGAFATYDSPLNSAFAAAQTQAIAGLAAVADALKTPLDAITGSSSREEERAAIRDLSVTVAQMTVRLDQIEHAYGARLDELSDRIDQNSATRFADIAARLDKVEQKAAAPAAPAAQFADIATRLDKLEKGAALAAQPAAQIAEITIRLDKLEKTAAVLSAPTPEAGENGPRLDRPEKGAAGAAASATAPLPPQTPKEPLLIAKAEPSAANEKARSDNPDNPGPLLRNYSVDYVQGGIAVVDGRYGSQQVAPGDMIPGAGHVLRIERRGGNWVVVTTLGVIAGGPAPR